MTLQVAGDGHDPERALMGQLRDVLRDLHGVLALKDRDHLPPPDRHVDPSAKLTSAGGWGLMAKGGVEWAPCPEKWIVRIPVEDDDPEHFVYVETPRDFAGDVTPLRIGDARALGLALLAAADWAAEDLWRRQGRRP